jgi:hypothetical protein
VAARLARSSLRSQDGESAIFGQEAASILTPP